jgi:hypothetical protein
MDLNWKKSYYGWWDAYTADGTKIKVPSVTAIVNFMDDPEMDKWVEEIGEEQAQKIMKLAADRGTVMHYYLENYYRAIKSRGDMNKALLYTQRKTPEMAKGEGIAESSIKIGRDLFYQLYESSMSSEIYQVLGLENKIASFNNLYRGKYDINYITNDGKNIITDFKTSSSNVKIGSTKERKMKLQLAGYWTAYEEMFPNIKLDYAKLWISVKDGMPQEISINKEEKENCMFEFLDLCKKYHESIGQGQYIISN